MLTLNQVLYYFKQLFKLFLKNFILITAVSIVCGLIGFFYAYSSKPKYTALTTFVLSNSSQSSGLGGLASQFGIDIGFNGGDVFSDENIVSLMTSSLMIKKSLFSFSKEKNDYLINIFIKELRLNVAWQSKERTKNLFPFHPSQQGNNLVADSLVNEMVGNLQENYLLVYRIDKKQSIYAVKTTFTDEVFSVLFTNSLVQNTSDFYITTKTQTASKNLKLIQGEADSLRNILNSSISTTAFETDKVFNLNPSKQIARSNIQKSQVSVSVLTAAYGEVLKNLEIAKITLQRETPLFQIIDKASFPLKKMKKSKLFALIGGGLIGFILSLFIVIFISIIKKID